MKFGTKDKKAKGFLGRFILKLCFFSILISCRIFVAYAGPFPVKGTIFDGQDRLVGAAHVYPRYVEIFDNSNIMVGKVGILVEEGIARLFLVDSDQRRTLVGYATSGQIFDQNDKIKGSYF